LGEERRQVALRSRRILAVLSFQRLEHQDHLQHGIFLAEHHLQKFPVSDGSGVGGVHLFDHSLQLEMGFGLAHGFHHLFEFHEVDIAAQVLVETSELPLIHRQFILQILHVVEMSATNPFLVDFLEIGFLSFF